MRHRAALGLGFGDESKGAVVDRLSADSAQPVTAVVRFNGGMQAGHNVVMKDGRHHTFSQFGSGTFRGVPTILSKFMVIEPIGFLREEEHLRTVLRQPGRPVVMVDENCLIATPWHMALNRAAEQDREEKHGTCGLGFGETIAYSLAYPDEAPRVRDTWGRMIIKLLVLQKYCADRDIEVGNDPREVVAAYRAWREHVLVYPTEYIYKLINEGHCIFEGAQGVLLDQNYGFHPHTTWSTTTYDNIDELVDDPDEVERLGVLRCYTTRHGEGPLPTEDRKLTKDLPEIHNGGDGFQGAFRVGHFDNCLHAYAVDVCGRVDSVVITHMDTMRTAPQVCIGYDLDGQPWWPPRTEGRDLATMAATTEKLKRAKPFYTKVDRKDFISFIEPQLDVPVSMTSWGPTAEDKQVIRKVSA